MTTSATIHDHASAASDDPWADLPQVRTVEQLESYGRPTRAVRHKVLTRLGEVHREWIAASPLVLVATSSGSGECDVSPKGDPRGLVTVLDEQTLVLPERAGNRRMDGFRNILENPHAGLLFLVPGRPETMRANGTARIVTDGPFFDAMTVRGHRPELALLLRVEEVFFHCPKAFLRSRAWRPDSWRPGAVRPYAEIAHALWRSTSTLEEVREHYRTSPDDELYPTSAPR